MRIAVRWMQIGAALVLAACAQQPTRTTAVPAVDDAALNALYAELAAAASKGDEGLALHASGDSAGADAALSTARVAFTALAGRCLSLTGCEIERVLAAQDALLLRQAQTLTRAETADSSVDDEPAELAQQSPVVTLLPQAGRSLSLLNGRELRDLIQDNEATRAALEEWLTWLRPNLIDAWENYQYMRHRMWPAYERAGLPEALLFGMLAKESGGKVHAVSRAGASGPLQFMYHTGLRYGLGREGGFDTRFDPGAAARANASYLNDQFRVLNNNLELALGAYNGGEGRVNRLSQSGKRGFWDPRVFNQLPPETRDYVPMVLAAAWLFLHPEQYGLAFPAIDATPGQIVLTQPLSLNELSVCMGQQGNPRGWFRTLRNLNPRYEPETRLAAGTTLDVPLAAQRAFDTGCTDSARLALSQQLHEARMPGVPAGARVASSGARTHVVRRGETLSSIARKFGCGDVKAIAQANRIAPPRYAIRAGQRLVVPACRNA